VIVVLDLRFEGVDVVLDPLGWLVALFALAGLAKEHPAFGIASLACLVGGAVSVPDWFGPGGNFVTLVTGLAETVVVFATCTGVMAVCPQERRTADRLRWWVLGLGLALLALAPAARDLAALVIAVGLAGVVVFVLFLVMLFRAARYPRPAAIGS